MSSGFRKCYFHGRLGYQCLTGVNVKVCKIFAGQYLILSLKALIDMICFIVGSCLFLS